MFIGEIWKSLPVWGDMETILLLEETADGDWLCLVLEDGRRVSFDGDDIDWYFEKKC